MLQLIKTNGIITLKRMQSTQVGDNNITYEKIYNKLIDNPTGFRKELLRINYDKMELIDDAFIRSYIVGNSTNWKKVTSKARATLALFLRDMHAKNYIKIEPSMLMVYTYISPS